MTGYDLLISKTFMFSTAATVKRAAGVVITVEM
jgi:hypothetical protein